MKFKIFFSLFTLSLGLGLTVYLFSQDYNPVLAGGYPLNLPTIPAPGTDYVRDELVVIKNDRVEKIKVKPEMLVDEARRLRRLQGVSTVEVNYLAQKQAFVPDDPDYDLQWNFDLLGMADAWENSTGSDVVVAVVDSGVTRVADLLNTTFVEGYDFVDEDTDPADEDGHGTHVAGTIAQSTNNAYGVAGIAFNAKIMPVRVLDENGNGSYYDIYLGILWAVDHGADVVNLSLGGTSSSSVLQQAVRYAYDRGVTVVSASGNSGKTSANGVLYPAAYDQYVVSVGAVRFDKQRAYYSNGGNALDFVAPGGDLQVDQNNDGYKDGILQQTLGGLMFYQGTSMATAHISGLVALLLQIEPGLDMNGVEARLRDSTQDLGSSGWDRLYGYGLPNAAQLLGIAPIIDPSPTSIPTSTPTPTLVPTATPTLVPTSAPTLTPTPSPASSLQRICLRYPWLSICN